MKTSLTLLSKVRAIHFQILMACLASLHPPPVRAFSVLLSGGQRVNNAFDSYNTCQHVLYGVIDQVPDSYLRSLYDRQVGRTKGTYDFAKSLTGTGVNATLLLQKLTSPVGWLDPDSQRKVKQAYSFGIAASEVYATWEFGTLQEEKLLLQQFGAIAGRIYEEAKNNINRQWAETKRSGKQQELIERWKTRLLLEVGTFALGLDELRAGGIGVRGIESSDLVRNVRATEILGRPQEEIKAAEDINILKDVSGQPRLSEPPSKPPIHARYADGTPVYEGEQPPRLPDHRDPAAGGPHTVSRWDGKNGRIYQGREYDAAGNKVRDLDHTNPTFPNGTFRPGHPGPPHQHRWIANDPLVGPRFGLKRGGPEPLEKN